MSEYCKECGYAVEDLSPSQIGELLTSYKQMYTWEDAEVGFEANVPGLGNVEVVYNSYLTVDDNDSIKLVWKTRFGYVGVTGYYSSYSGSRWNMDFSRAEAKTKEVIYFE